MPNLDEMPGLTKVMTCEALRECYSIEESLDDSESEAVKLMTELAPEGKGEVAYAAARADISELKMAMIAWLADSKEEVFFPPNHLLSVLIGIALVCERRNKHAWMGQKMARLYGESPDKIVKKYFGKE